MKAPFKTIERIAKKHLLLGIGKNATLQRQNRDSLDFHDCAVWSIEAALQEAYQLGFEKGQKKERDNNIGDILV